MVRGYLQILQFNEEFASQHKRFDMMIGASIKEDRVVLSIKDRGNGIPPEVMEKLGTPFFTTKDTGTGLGLSICYRIVENHNARIEIETGKSGTTALRRG